MRRYTTVRIAIFAMILQSALSLASFATFVHAYWRAWTLLGSAYPATQRWLWLAALLWSLVSLICGIALARGRAWGRALYACAAFITLAVYFLMSPWTLALSALPVAALTIGVLYSRAGTHYLVNHAASSSTASGWRARLAIVCLALSSALLYVTDIYMITHAGWMEHLFPDSRPLYFLIISSVLLTVAAFFANKGSRMWSSGIALMVFVVVTVATLLGYVPYAPALARYLGPAYRSYPLRWGGVIFSLFIVGVVALTMLQTTRVTRGQRVPLTMPDYQ
jgi:hypothetical protein